MIVSVQFMKFLFVAQTPSENTCRLRDAALQSLSAHAPRHSEVIGKSPIDVSADDLFSCDGLLIGCLENIGALSGLTKDMFDRCYNDWLGQTGGLPVGIYIRAGLDGTATKRTLESYAKAQAWRLIREPIILHGTYNDHMCEDVAELAGMLSAGVGAGIY